MATFVATMLLTAAGIAGVMGAIYAWNLDDLARRGLRHQAQWLAEGLRFDAAGRPVALKDDRDEPWVYESASDDLKYRVLARDGTVLLSSEPGAGALVPDGERFDAERGDFEFVANGIRLRAATIPIEHNGTRFYLQSARSMRLNALALRAIGHPVLKTMAWTGLISLLLFGGVAYLTLRRMLRPLREASAAAARIEPHNLSTRLAAHDLPTEIAPLVDAFNLALDRLERGYRVQQEFLAGAAHELKTPLALIRAQIEMDGGADRAALLRDVDLMARQVHQLLHLAEASESQNYVYEPTDLGAVAGDVANYLGRLADRQQIALQIVAPPGGITLHADRSALFVLLKNLVENAIRHSPAGGVVTLTIAADGLRVRDAGGGIAADDFERLFDRFWRSAGRRDDGAGLGLSICREVARAHGWQLSARNAAPGAEFALVFRPA